MTQKQTCKTLNFVREAGQVTRSHTNVHDGKYTVGLHSFNAANLVLLYHPNPSLNLIKAVMWHDLAERHVGDVPSPILKHVPELREAYVKAEGMVFDHYGLKVPDLTTDEIGWFVTVDKLELYLWALEQAVNGNKRFEEYIIALYDWYNEYDSLVPEELKPLWEHRWSRNKDMIDFNKGENDE